MKVYGVIMAGGGGTRFWPLSRKETPKQLLNLSGKDIMVNEAINRLAQVTSCEDIFIVTNITQKRKMLDLLNGKISDSHILAEPCARNTAACIGYAATEIVKKYGDGIMVITPSDAYIKNEKKFARVLRTAIHAADTTDKLVTIGITPTFPATGYGYIQYTNCSNVAKLVLKFVEKPNLRTAKKYIKSGEFVWNSGMFVWRASTILQKFQEFLPEAYEVLQQIAQSFGKEDESKQIETLYPQIPSISIDYGIMEKCNDILVVPGEFGWNDIGSWDMFDVLHGADEKGNIGFGDVISVATKNTTVYSSGKLVTTVGVDNLIIVETPDAILVCRKDKAQDVKKIVDELQNEGREEFL